MFKNNNSSSLKTYFGGYKLSVFLAFSYHILFNISLIFFKFDYYKVNLIRSILELTKDSLYIILTLSIIFYGLSINRILFNISSIFLFITGAIANYVFYFFHIMPTTSMIRIAFENELSETYASVSWYLILWVSTAIIVCTTILWKFKTKHYGKPNYIIKTICLVLVVINIMKPQYKVLMSYFPISYLHSTYLYIASKYQNHSKIDISKKYQFINNAPDNILGVLVIGESARYDHFGLNGYQRDTTPHLSQIKNLFSFKAESSANATYLSVPSMLTMTTRQNIEEAVNQTTFLSVFTKLGFQTSWIGTQTIMKYLKGYNAETMYDEAQIVMIPGGSALYPLNAHDEVIIPYIDQILQQNHNRQIIVIHTSGSHWNYAARHPQSYNKFIPSLGNKTTRIDQPNCNHEELINSYDNSILYTDYVLSELIQKLQDKNAFLIYASDHGESLGENGIYAHGSHMNKEQLTIPFIIWFSDSFIERNKAIVEQIKSLQTKQLSHDHIFHSILGCTGIESSAIDPNLNLCHINK